MTKKNYLLLRQAIFHSGKLLEILKRVDLGDKDRLPRIQGHVIAACRELGQIDRETLEEGRDSDGTS